MAVSLDQNIITLTADGYCLDTVILEVEAMEKNLGIPLTLTLSHGEQPLFLREFIARNRDILTLYSHIMVAFHRMDGSILSISMKRRKQRQ